MKDKQIIMSRDVWDEVIELLGIEDTHSHKMVVTFEVGEPVEIEHYFLASKKGSDE